MNFLLKTLLNSEIDHSPISIQIEQLFPLFSQLIKNEWRVDCSHYQYQNPDLFLSTLLFGLLVCKKTFHTPDLFLLKEKLSQYITLLVHLIETTHFKTPRYGCWTSLLSYLFFCKPSLTSKDEDFIHTMNPFSIHYYDIQEYFTQKYPYYHKYYINHLTLITYTFIKRMETYEFQSSILQYFLSNLDCMLDHYYPTYPSNRILF